MIKLNPNGSASVIFDLIRFLAAVCVVSGHAVSRIFGEYNHESNNGVVEQLFRTIFAGYGSPAVMVFFVLSGLFIGSSVIFAIQNQRFSLTKYLSRRLIRLWVVVIPGLIITFILDAIGLNFFSYDLMYAGTDALGSISERTLTFSSFIGNIFFVQTILVKLFGTNGALWSLANEFWYYVAFPFLCFLLFPSFKFLTKLVSLLCLILLFVFVTKPIATLFLVWLLGVSIIFIKKNKINTSQYFLWGSGLAFTVVLVYHRIFTITEDKLLEQLIVGVLFFLFALTIVLNDKNFIDKPGFSKACRTLANFSFTLYVIHTPVISLLRAIFIGDKTYWDVTIVTFLQFFLILTVTLLISYFLAKYTEHKTKAIYQLFKV